jgi:hypothetical protein
MALDAAPMITPVAVSTTLPCLAKSRKSLSIQPLWLFYSLASPTLPAAQLRTDSQWPENHATREGMQWQDVMLTCPTALIGTIVWAAKRDGTPHRRSRMPTGTERWIGPR